MTFEALENRVGRRGLIGIALVGVSALGLAGLGLSSWGGSKTLTMASRSPAGETRLATPNYSISGYESPGGRWTGTIPVTWHNRTSVLPVAETRPGWLRVRVPWRPNGATAWVRASDVSLRGTAYRIVIDISAARLKLYDHGRLAFSAPAGVGAPDDPTPTGHFFVAFDEPPPRPNPGYGSFIMVTSAHSVDIKDWEGSGDAIIGIHGPLGADRAIGTSGARISHGCVRLHEQALRKLAHVPPGTPIDVIR